MSRGRVYQHANDVADYEEPSLRRPGPPVYGVGAQDVVPPGFRAPGMPGPGGLGIPGLEGGGSYLGPGYVGVPAPQRGGPVPGTRWDPIRPPGLEVRRSALLRDFRMAQLIPAVLRISPPLTALRRLSRAIILSGCDCAGCAGVVLAVSFIWMATLLQGFSPDDFPRPGRRGTHPDIQPPGPGRGADFDNMFG